MMRAVLALALVSSIACGRPGGAHGPAAPAVTDRDWELITLGEERDPKGNDGRRLTLRLDAATGRAAGFAGCNRWGAGYMLEAERLTFDAPLATRMACADGMDVERRFLAALPAVTGWQATATTLVLSGPDGLLMRFQGR